jgi:nicotinamide mononucleotide transporter
MISTAIFVYILLKAGLIGDFLINAYYFVMSIYGWLFWTRQEKGEVVHQIDKISTSEKKWSFYLFVLSLLFVGCVYGILGKWNSWTAPIDYFYNGSFFRRNVVDGKTKNRTLGLLDNWRFNFQSFVFVQRTCIN